MWIDIADCTLHVDKKEALKVDVDNHKLKITYKEGWEEYMQCPEWVTLCQAQATKIEKGEVAEGKAAGKYKKGAGKASD